LFFNIAFKISDKVSFVTPGRFLFNAGKTPKEWNNKILNDKHFKVIRYEKDSSKIFPNVDIKGGVAITFRDNLQEFTKIGVFSSYPMLGMIASKVKSFTNFEPLSDIIFSQNKFKLNFLFRDFPDYKSIVGSSGTEKRLTTSIFEQLNLFRDYSDNKTDVRILGLINNVRIFKFLANKYIESHENLEKFKVLLPFSNGSGDLGEVLSSPVVAEPFTGYTQSFISFGAFETLFEAKAIHKYLHSRFARALLGVLKVTQHNSKEVWQFIPLQDFTAESDINWSNSISEIDQQLYKKYQLSEEEIAFIEENVQAMV
jgi:hypothetical protein